MPGKEIDLSADTKAVPVTPISRDAGYNLHWSGVGSKVHWSLGDEYFSTPLQQRFAFLPGAPDSLPALDSTGIKIGLTLQADKPSGYIALTGARIITMNGDEVLKNGDVVVTGNRIVGVGPRGSVSVPAGSVSSRTSWLATS